ncbi:hypothetical protein [Pelosinus sp. UFO1]|uniref:hypothetical protein n=1 Tax=Pelosinus sp. UFO1 TaxID=484770 RepID=UPI0004D17350|nr:hypothetical protein [Pelosinus sp. UFO1]AIF54108.1 hypothetical protein UFO1_4573 [Pelosinus sp. UFO1]
MEAKVIEAFHMMWDNFPEAVMLIHKSREILAVNNACRNAGGVVGGKCSELGGSERHKGCLANQAIATNKATYSKSEVGGKEIIGYWIPLTDYPDIYVHFGVGIMVDYNKSC